MLFDSTIVSKSPHVSSHSSLSYLLSNLFDFLVALNLAKLENHLLFTELMERLRNSVGVSSLSKYIRQPDLLEEDKSINVSILCHLRENFQSPYSIDVAPTTAMRYVSSLSIYQSRSSSLTLTTI